jgi:Asp-tRNA(Asn)/Glu-tRNA(Gln) amidotransferase A subunit family amidase
MLPASLEGLAMEKTARAWPRREVLKAISAAGIGSAAFLHAVASVSESSSEVTAEMVRQAEWITGLELTDSERQLMLEDLNESQAQLAELRSFPLGNEVPPALYFEPSPGDPRMTGPAVRGSAVPGETAAIRPESPEDLAFATVSELSSLLRTGRVSSTELTRLYLERLERDDPLLHCVITMTSELALEQADLADRELSAGRYRGPLHGVPWGAKDLLAVPGYRTTWGAKPFKDQVRPETATVASRLREAGAPLLAKLSVGALAWGDVWFEEMTRNPWNPEQGSSGSSAGPAAATAAGLVGFAIGTETYGSIVSPCTRCGASGLRPTFGRVSRHGVMALSWSMDKIGPIARSVEDCALVFDAIHGADGLDPTAVDRPFAWPPRRDPRALRVGYLESAFKEDRTEDVEVEAEKAALREWQEYDLATLDALRGIGIEPVPVELPDGFPVEALLLTLKAEAATAFDALTRSGRDEMLVRQVKNAWPNVFRQGQLVPAVDYLRANRVRTLLMQAMERVTAEVDVWVSPSYGGDNLLLTNLTGHPAVVVPNGFRGSDGTPTSITFMAGLYREEDALSVAHAYQQATGFHLRRPDPKAAAAEGDS